MSRVKTGLVICLIAVAAAVLLSGAQDADPQTPTALSGLPAPFLGTSLVGGGASAIAAVDSYGNIVDMRLGGPGAPAEIEINRRRQGAGTVDRESSGIVPMTSVGESSAPTAPWNAQAVTQRYIPGTNILVTRSTVGGALMKIIDSADGSSLVRRFTVVAAPDAASAGGPGPPVTLKVGVHLEAETKSTCVGSVGSRVLDGGVVISWHGTRAIRAALTCSLDGSEPTMTPPQAMHAAAGSDRKWLEQSSGLGRGAPAWATRMYERSLLVIRALTDPTTGSQIAALRNGWDFIWPRDAATGSMALNASGHTSEATRIVEFLSARDTDDAARFNPDGSPVDDGRAAQGDGAGWTYAAAKAVGVTGVDPPTPDDWRGRGDYEERSDESGDLLSNAIAGGASAAEILDEFGVDGRLVRKAGDDGSGLDAATAWAITPFRRAELLGPAVRTLETMLPPTNRYGIPAATDWNSDNPWSSPTAWTAWSMAAIGKRAMALELLAGVRRSLTPTGMIPERVGPTSGLPRSATPLAWSHALVIMALTRLWPPDPDGAR